MSMIIIQMKQKELILLLPCNRLAKVDFLDPNSKLYKLTITQIKHKNSED